MVLLFASCSASADPGSVSDTPPSAGPVTAENETIQVTKVLRGLVSPWGIDFLPDGSLLVTEQAGNLYIYKNDSLSKIQGVPAVSHIGQGGLLDVHVHPDFDTNSYVFLSYSDYYNGGYGTAVSRYQLAGNQLTHHKRVFRVNIASGGGRHFGSRITTGSDGYVYITTGERGNSQRAQDLQDHAGKVIRITVDGKIPPDNPFIDDPEVLNEIYSYGHRNPQGLTHDPATGAIYVNEHGAKGGDELNIIRPGANYGWPIISYGTHYDDSTIGEGRRKEGMKQPITYWDPSLAPSGLVIYRGDVFPSWKGYFLLGALKFKHIRLIEFDGTNTRKETELFRNTFGRIRQVAVDPQGYIWFINDENDGGVFRIEPAD